VHKKSKPPNGLAQLTCLQNMSPNQIWCMTVESLGLLRFFIFHYKIINEVTDGWFRIIISLKSRKTRHTARSESTKCMKASKNAQNPLDTFPRNFPVDAEVANLLRTCGRLISDTVNKSATSRCNRISETTRHNRHNGLASANLLRGNWCNGFWPQASTKRPHLSSTRIAHCLLH